MIPQLDWIVVVAICVAILVFIAAMAYATGDYGDTVGRQIDEYFECAAEAKKRREKEAETRC